MAAPRGSDVQIQATLQSSPNGGRNYGGGEMVYRVIKVPRKQRLGPAQAFLGLGSALAFVYLFIKARRG